MTPTSFQDMRVLAAEAFVQTMVLVDDEAINSSKSSAVSALTTPTRANRKPDKDINEIEGEGGSPSENLTLDVSSLVKSALDSKLLCTVVCPDKDDTTNGRIVNAAEIADITCLDWEIHGDNGATACAIIRQLLECDKNKNGRLRLIAIYTGKKAGGQIIKDVQGKISDDVKQYFAFNEDGQNALASDKGARIVILNKSHGTQAPSDGVVTQVSEDRLPETLKQEFAKLSQGILSNIALATIAEIRNVTHHTLAAFRGDLDGPYMHHLMLSGEDVTREYAVDVIVSHIKGNLPKQKILGEHSGTNQLCGRATEIRDKIDKLVLNKDNDTYEVADIDSLVKIIEDGVDGETDVSQAFNSGSSPTKKEFKKNFSTLFASEPGHAENVSLEFSALTSLSAHQGSLLYKANSVLPVLSLGTVIRDATGKHLLCIQAACDTVRVKGPTNFIFVELYEDGKEHNQVLPTDKDGGEFVGFRSGKYQDIVRISFDGDANTGMVAAEYDPKLQEHYFCSTAKEGYCWVANIKKRRALRIAQNLSRDLGRLGLDEFAPHIRK